jgi:hypothetical protein
MKKNVLSSMFGLGVILISLFSLASCRLEEKVAVAASLPEKAGAVYAMDPVDLKLFNAAGTASTNVTAAKTGITYAMDPVDLKLFSTTRTTATFVPATLDPADRKFFTNYK